MRLFAYYAVHASLNALRKLFKTWVAVFLIVCVAVGVLVGLSVGIAVSLIPEDEPAQEQTLPEETVTLPEDEDGEDVISSEFDRAQALRIAELAVGGVVLLVLVLEAVLADKSGSAIFLPADITLLFPSPLKPQSVLLFRLMTQLGLVLISSVYMLFQLPNLIRVLELNAWTALALLAAWILLLVFGKLLQVLLYTVSSTHEKWKARLRPIVIVFLALLASGFLLYWRQAGLGILEAATRFFNAPLTRFIPVWGWIKGFFMGALEGDTLACLGFFAALILGAVGLVVLIWRIRADFYEDAMQKTEELAAMRADAEKGGRLFSAKKKTRSEKLRREGFDRGRGANVFFFKALYNRARFSFLHYFTKTCLTYLLCAVALALIERFLIQTDLFLPVPLLLGAMAFFRSLGNPVIQDIRVDCFVMIPEKAWSKLFFSLAGGTVVCLLDLLPAMLAAALILGASPLLVPAWMLFIASLDFYSSSAGVFLDLSLPDGMKKLKQVIQVVFVEFGLAPTAVIFIIGIATGQIALAAIIASLASVGIGFAVTAFSPLFLERGRK